MTRIEREAVLHNLRQRWPEQLKHLSDDELVALYDDFSMSEDYGDNDAKFLGWI